MCSFGQNFEKNVKKSIQNAVNLFFSLRITSLVCLKWLVVTKNNKRIAKYIIIIYQIVLD